MPADFAWYAWILVTLAAVGAGFVNAVAGGGTLITFPTLTALGVLPVPANVTNAVAVAPGHFGATWSQRANLAGQRSRLLLLLPPAILGGFAGALLLLRTPASTFRELIPWLILIASLLLAAQDTIRKWIVRRAEASGRGTPSTAWAIPLVFIAAIYGGYFSAGISIIFLAVLGVAIDDSLTRLNALKQTLSFVVTLASSIFFIASGVVIWPLAIVMAVGALIGGALGGRFATMIAPATLRKVVVVAGILIAAIYFVR